MVPTPAVGDHVFINWVYGEPTGLWGEVEVKYVEVDKAPQGGRVRIHMGDGYTVCLNGPVGYAYAPATQTAYVQYEWRGCQPFNPLWTFTYRLTRGNDGYNNEIATATFDWDYGSPGVFHVEWRAGNEHGWAEGSGYVVAA